MVRISKSVKLNLLTIATMTVTTLFASAGEAADRYPSQSAFLPAGRQIAAPTAFLEMCSRSPEDCQQSTRPEAARIVSLARQAMVDKYDQAFANQTSEASNEPAPGAVAASPWSHRTGNRLSDMPSPVSPASDYVRITLDRDTLTTLKAVNARVNRDLIADTDARIYHVNDYWEAPALARGAHGDCEDFALLKRRLLIAQGVPAAALSLAIVRTRFNEDHAVLVVATQQGDYVLDNLAYSVKPWQKTGYAWVSRQGPGDDLRWVSLQTPAASAPNRATHIATTR